MDRDACFWQVMDGKLPPRGKEICFLSGELLQQGKILAKATAVALIRKQPPP